MDLETILIYSICDKSALSPRHHTYVYQLCNVYELWHVYQLWNVYQFCNVYELWHVYQLYWLTDMWVIHCLPQVDGMCPGHDQRGAAHQVSWGGHTGDVSFTLRPYWTGRNCFCLYFKLTIVNLYFRIV